MEQNKMPEALETFADDFRKYMELFAVDVAHLQAVEDLKKESQLVWNGLLMYLNKQLIEVNRNELLKLTNKNEYDFNKLLYIYEIYKFNCLIYSKEISINGFSYLTNIDLQSFTEWNHSRTNPKAVAFVQKVKGDRQESLSAMLQGGNKNVVGVLAILNKWYGWNDNNRTENSGSDRLLSSEQLPKLAKLKDDLQK